MQTQIGVGQLDTALVIHMQSYNKCFTSTNCCKHFNNYFHFHAHNCFTSETLVYSTRWFDLNKTFCINIKTNYSSKAQK